MFKRDLGVGIRLCSGQYGKDKSSWVSAKTFFFTKKIDEGGANSISAYSLRPALNIIR